MTYGASAEDRKVFNELMKDAANKRCMECDAPNPQWAGVHHGVFICLDCAGTHRGLGVHLSLVRSITMDSWTQWKPEKLKQMQLGGNAKALEFFKAHGTPGRVADAGARDSIRARYNHLGAFMYRDKLEHLALGKPWSEEKYTPPPEYNPDWDKPPVRKPTGARLSGMGSRPPPQASGGVKFDEAGKAVSDTFSKLGQLGLSAGSAIMETGKKVGSSASESATNAREKIDTQAIARSAEASWQKASASAVTGWSWFSSTVQKAAAQASTAISGESGDGFSEISKNMGQGPVGEGDNYLQGEMVVWQPRTGAPERAVISAVDDRTDPPTYILKLDDGGKRGAAHSQLRKWGQKFEHASSDPAAPEPASASSGPPAPSGSPAPAGEEAVSPKPVRTSPVRVSKPAVAKPVKKEADGWDDWGEDGDWGGSSKKDD
ncbi:putative ADP-ribosylation factor GTPase-activating protein AGD6 [Diplonema papillatum]|nr:putative ADP-ribosylation factor GTPase-activating protein AGD6 [Diplonema papillatum]